MLRTKYFYCIVTVFELSLRHFSPYQIGSNSTTHMKCLTTTFEIALDTRSRVTTFFHITYDTYQVKIFFIQFLDNHPGVFDFYSWLIFRINSDMLEPNFLLKVNACLVKPFFSPKPVLGFILVNFCFNY